MSKIDHPYIDRTVWCGPDADADVGSKLEAEEATAQQAMALLKDSVSSDTPSLVSESRPETPASEPDYFKDDEFHCIL